MSKAGRAQDTLHSLLWERDNGYHAGTPGLLADLPRERVSEIEDKILDALYSFFWEPPAR